MYSTPTLATRFARNTRVLRADVPLTEHQMCSAAPYGMVQKLAPLKPLVGGETLALWQSMAANGDVDALFESVMVRHYDPCYARSTRRNYVGRDDSAPVALQGLDRPSLDEVARRIAG